MSRQDEIQISKEEKTEPVEVVYLLEQLPDGTLRIGNSHECPRSEAIQMIRASLAKSADAPIGEVPESWG